MRKGQIFLLFILFSSMPVCYIKAQTIQLVPNPQPVGSGVEVFNNNFGNKNTIVYNNKLYIQYAASAGVFQMAEYDGTTLTLIPNPDAGLGYGYLGSAYPIIYNNKLYFQYSSLNGCQLGTLNGNKIDLIPNPDTGLGFFETYPIVYNNKIIIQYRNESNTGQLAQYDGTSLTLIPAPGVLKTFADFPPIIMNNKLYFEVTTTSGVTHLAQYDGTTLTIIPNPDGNPLGFGREPILYNNKIYAQYENAAGIYQTAQYDGTTLTLLPNPDGGIGSGYTGNFNYVIYNNKLYIQNYEDASNQVYHMAVFDGNTISLVPNVSNGQAYEFDFPAIVYNNKLYFEYLDSIDVAHLGQYDGNTIVQIPNPDFRIGQTYFSPPIIYNGKLYIGYEDASGYLRLAAYDGTSVSLIPNPDAGYFAAGFIEYNNTIYFDYYSTTSGHNQLGYLSNCTPVTTKISIVSDATDTICHGTKVTFAAIPINGGLAPTYQWFKNGMNVGTNDSIYSDSNLKNKDSIFCKLTSNALCVLNVTSWSDTIVMKVGNNPSITITASDSVICKSSLVTFIADTTNVGSNTIYQWQKNGINVGTDSAVYIDSTLNNNDSISCILNTYSSCAKGRIKDTSNKIGMKTAKICPPIITSFNPVKACGSHDTITISGHNFTGATTVSFGNTPALFFKVVNDSIIKALADTDTSGLVSVTTPGGIATRAGFIYNIPLIPSVNIVASPTDTICVGTSITFTAFPKNGGISPSFEWSLNGNNIGSNSPIYTSASLVNGDIISCKIISNGTCVFPDSAISNTLTIVVKPIITPFIHISASTTTVCATVPVTFSSATTNAGTSASYQWKVNGNNVGTNSPSYSSNALANGDMVDCILTSNAGCVSAPSDISNIIIMNVSDSVNTSINIASSANNICFGTPVTFTASSANGGNIPLYQWMVNGNNVESTSSTYTSNALQNNDVINCVLTSSLGCTIPVASNNDITMSVYPLPVVTDGTDKIIQLGTSIQLDLPVAGNIASYMWSPPDGLNNTGIKSPDANPSVNTTYELTVTTQNGCTATGKINVTVFSELLMPNAFTPNGDGHNDLFRIPPSIPVKINSFIIFNRWGNKIFYTNDASKGWDGSYGGEPQPEGVYLWLLTYIDPLKNEPKQLKGTVTLIR